MEYLVKNLSLANRYHANSLITVKLVAHPHITHRGRQKICWGDVVRPNVTLPGLLVRALLSLLNFWNNFLKLSYLLDKYEKDDKQKTWNSR